MKPTLLIAGIGVVLGGLIGYHGIYVRQKEQARLIQAQVAQEQADQDMQAEVAAMLEQVERYRTRLPQDPDPSWLVRDAVELGRSAGIEPITISQQIPTPFQQFTSLTIGLQFTATYHQLGTFLDSLERSDHFVRIDQLELQHSRMSDGKASVQLTLSTFYVPR